MRDADSEVLDVLLAVLDRQLEILIELDDPAGIFDGDLSLFCQAEGSVRAVKQLDSQILFQLADMLTDRRLGEPERLRRLCKTLFFHHRKQGGNLCIQHSAP